MSIVEMGRKGVGMNVRKGVIRLLVVWLIVWAVVAYFGWTIYDNAQDLWKYILAKGAYQLTDPTFSSLAKTASENSASGLYLIGLAFWLGLVFPIVSAIAFAVGRWVYRGFKS